MKKPSKHAPRGIAIREMRVDDIPEVYRLGHRLFKSQEASTFYRTWDAYEVTNNFNQDPHLTLVAESRKGRIVGFALGTTYGNDSGSWKYGYILWMGVSPRWQGSGLGRLLYHDMERRIARRRSTDGFCRYRTVQHWRDQILQTHGIWQAGSRSVDEQGAAAHPKKQTIIAAA